MIKAKCYLGEMLLGEMLLGEMLLGDLFSRQNVTRRKWTMPKWTRRNVPRRTVTDPIEINISFFWDLISEKASRWCIFYSWRLKGAPKIVKKKTSKTSLTH